MKKLLAIFFALAMPPAFAQTAKQSATVTIAVTAPAPAVQLTSQSASVQAGQTAVVTANVTQGGSPATGSIDLCAQVPGSTSYVFVQSFQLTAGSATCAYPIPANAPVGTYTIAAQYPGNGSCSAPATQ